jgi:hypothetical protein
MPPDSPDVDTGRKNLENAYRAMEMRLLHECSELSKSGFGDKRLSAAAYQKFEEAFLLLRKALRLDAGNDYGKVPAPGPFPRDFAPRVDDEDLYGADFKHIEWKDIG